MVDHVNEIAQQMPKYGVLRRLKRAAAKFYFDKTYHYKNIEGLAEYNFVRKSGARPRGTSVMLRAKNEERLIETTIRSIYRVFDEIVFIDNGSTDHTLSIVRQLKDEIDSEGKIRILVYPHSVARCGSEHQDTPENSVRSLVYYYNWCLSQLGYSYAVKWDADMYLKPELQLDFKNYLAQALDLEVQLETPVQTIYIDDSGNAFEAENEVNFDNRVFPNRNWIRYKKGAEWEDLHKDVFVPEVDYPKVGIYEIKETSQDEFSHWATTNFTTTRKQREWENFNLVKAGETSEGFKKVEGFKISRSYV